MLEEIHKPIFQSTYLSEGFSLPIYYTCFVSQIAVAGFSAHMDIGRAHEIANEARRIRKQLKESQQLALLYNNRERIFGMHVTNVSVQHFCPFIMLYIPL